jgi:hypothetical protein
VTLEEPAAIEALTRFWPWRALIDDPELPRFVAGTEEKIGASSLPLGGAALTAEAVAAKRAAGYLLLLVGFHVLMLEAAARGHRLGRVAWPPYRSASASLTPSAANAPAKARRIQASIAGLASTRSRMVAANSP